MFILSVDILFRANAFHRMGLCYLNLGEKKKALVSLNIAISCGNISIQEECNRAIENIDNLLRPNKKEQSKYKYVFTIIGCCFFTIILLLLEGLLCDIQS